MSDHRYEFKHRNGNTSMILYESNASTANSLLTDVYYFLLGCSFAKETIIGAMASIIDEYEEKSNDLE